MDFGGTVEIAAPREKVWEFVSDPRQVAACGPGAETVDVIDEDRCNALARIVIWPVNFRFNVQATFTQRRPPELATVTAPAARSPALARG
jgi:carbon monoxide dehydrogenase subunit G